MEGAPLAIRQLCEALLLLEDVQTVEKFLKDLCTPAELSALAERWRVCRLLRDGKHSYREIYALTGVSTATVTRVARYLRDSSGGGYRAVLEKIEGKKKS
ncbi:MAG: trp operon repressor [Puniceicoccales bacterium]|jgi:TrpR-related protein YerC/YecD|nr:trp operon repressor [Puniceicoccales bacterium]